MDGRLDEKVLDFVGDFKVEEYVQVVFDDNFRRLSLRELLEE